MKKEQLQSTLSNLHTEFESAGAIDDKTRAMLKTLTADIERLLDESNDSNDTDSITEQLRLAMVEFETDHPKISAAIHQVTDALSNLGI